MSSSKRPVGRVFLFPINKVDSLLVLFSFLTSIGLQLLFLIKMSAEPVNVDDSKN
ncbi:unnamed protein product [Citrullus colocynthis]|uniref:Uncharacterized protein n=1 Tax=Citrullus colocynthis TaxID=252529 RepID=A0ABP0YW44_9ROSI